MPYATSSTVPARPILEEGRVAQDQSLVGHGTLRARPSRACLYPSWPGRDEQRERFLDGRTTATNGWKVAWTARSPPARPAQDQLAVGNACRDVLAPPRPCVAA